MTIENDIKKIDERLKKQEKLMEVMVSHLDTQSNINVRHAKMISHLQYKCLGDDSISLCKECWCMTHTEDNKCKKCGKEKNA